jgi:DNA-binding response OmpR family regulator
MTKPVILIVDTNRSNLEMLSQELGQEGFETTVAASLDELDQAIRGKQKYALAVIDLSGFDEAIWERCDPLHEVKVPFIIIAPQRSQITQRESMKHGAGGVLVKPVSNKDLIEHIHTMLGD